MYFVFNVKAFNHSHVGAEVVEVAAAVEIVVVEVEAEAAVHLEEEVEVVIEEEVVVVEGEDVEAAEEVEGVELNLLLLSPIDMKEYSLQEEKKMH